jgi:hypothetical protein
MKPRTEIFLPRQLFRTESDDPKLPKLSIDAECWILALHRRDSVLPRARVFITDSVLQEPNIAWPNTDDEEPMRANVRNENELPSVRTLNVERLEPNLDVERSEIEEPNEA